MTENSDFPSFDGYRGIWYFNQKIENCYRYVYSGGLGTYCAKHRHLAHYAPEPHRTFFVYGGTKGIDDPKPLLIMASYFDHQTGTVPKPTVIMEKGTKDAHHNPTMTIDAEGHILVFASSHGLIDGFVWRSTEPYSTDRFELLCQKEFTYPQPYYHPDVGIVLLFTKYTRGRELYLSTSRDGREWSEDKKYVGFDGHYQVTSNLGSKLSTAFNWHPEQKGPNFRTNLYYLETHDFGETWRTVNGETVSLPLSSPDNEALVRNYRKEGLRVYLKDINFDKNRNPVILHLLSRTHIPGPESGSRIWMIAHWVGDRWLFKKITRSDHNYDTGSLYIEENLWRIIAPATPGPQPYCTGGEVSMWVSENEGQSWKLERKMTSESQYNHTYIRRPLNAHPEFYAFWADGNALEPSPSRLYFGTKQGEVFRLPYKMLNNFATPERI